VCISHRRLWFSDSIVKAGKTDDVLHVLVSGVARQVTPYHNNNYFTEMCSGSEAGSYLRLIDFCITQL